MAVEINDVTDKTIRKKNTTKNQKKTKNKKRTKKKKQQSLWYETSLQLK